MLIAEAPSALAIFISSSCRLLLHLLLLAIAGLGALITYRLFLHPLARIPGPKLAAASSIWLAYHSENGTLARLGIELHKKHGHVVRVGPNEIWLNSPEALSAIYGSNFSKSDFYWATALTKPRLDWRLRGEFPDTLDLLSERNLQRYRLQRRLIGPVYRTANVIKHESAVDVVLDQVIKRLRARDREEVDLKEWMHIIAVECLAAIVLSWSPGMLKHETDWSTSTHSYQGWRLRSVLGLFPLIVKMSCRSKTILTAFTHVWGLRSQQPQNLRSFFPGVQKKINGRINALLRQPPPKIGHKDLMADLVQLHLDKPDFSKTYLKRMGITNFGAGHETLASTLTATVAMITSHPNVQDKVDEELKGLRAPVDFASSAQLMYTQATIKEAKRLHPVIGTSLPRTVPASGLYIHEFYIPSGTTVGCHVPALHQNPETCSNGADPRCYDPDRWMDAEAARRMERCSLAWGGGSRSCPGRNLAELVLFKVVPTLLSAFEVQVVMPPEEEQKTYFLSMLTGIRARFIPRQR